MRAAPTPYPLSVYVHVPFCDYRCRYCNFTFETGWSPALLQRTLDALVDEAERERELWQADGLAPRFHTLYLGGGTPGVIPPDSLVPFFERLHRALGASSVAWSEAGFEVNPENVSVELLDALAQSGVTRLSVGIQSFDTARLHVLGRWCDRETNRRALDLIATRWRGSWSADLMTGLPGAAAQGGAPAVRPQTWTDLRADLDTLLAYDPPHVSLYSLTVEPGTALHTMVNARSVQAPRPAVSDQLWIRARDTLVGAGYEWYEISNFARRGHRSAHNPVYWRMEPWLGLGPGAEGNLVSRTPEGLWRPVRTRNPRLFPWLTGSPDLRPREVLSAPEFWLEHFLTGWRTSDGVDGQKLQATFDHLPADLRWRLSDDERLTLNAHLAKLPDGDDVRFRLNWFTETT